MPRKHGLRDDDMLGRMADIETRLDILEGVPVDRRVATPTRDERRDTDPRNRQVMVAESDREEQPNPPDSMDGAAQDDNVTIVDADDRTRSERRAKAKADAKNDGAKKDDARGAPKAASAAPKDDADKQPDDPPPGAGDDSHPAETRSSFTNPFAAPADPKTPKADKDK